VPAVASKNTIGIKTAITPSIIVVLFVVLVDDVVDTWLILG
jgi:hypothetical protein